ncbi:MAG: DUF2182 domain-containing protein [Candidatus Geothermarchaeales archaeon]
MAAESDVVHRFQRADLPRRAKVLIGGGLLLVSALAWAVTLQSTNAISMGLPGFVALWTVMMAAMMLPSVLPTVLLFATIAPSRSGFGFPPAPTATFVAGYLAIWSLAGIGVGLAGESFGSVPSTGGQLLIGGALITAGAFQLTRWKAFCLGHCRSPMQFFMDHWHDGANGAVLMGAHHGLYCVGCCWGLMLALIALGMMNPTWMVLVAAAVFVEKVVPRVDRIAAIIGVGLLLAGLSIAIGPLSPLTGM